MTSLSISCRLAGVLMLVAASASADHADESAIKAGHSVHGESFSEGPRQRAELLPGVAGVCHFPVTTKNPEAQQFFDQGVAQLHGFWYLEAERSFRHVLLLDPECMMAHWGIAMANIENAERAGKVITDAMKLKLDHLTPRERAWLQSLSDFYEKKKGGNDERERLRNLVRDWEQIVVDHPDDVEAKAFLVGRIWRNQNHDLRITSHLALDALANEVLAKSPRHPGIHHYRIHFWNNEKDERAITSAALLGPSAPGIAHNWHMPGHTYSALKRYADAAWQQEASARVDHAHMIRFHVMPDEIHNYAHNNGWLVEDYVYLGRAREAVALAKNLIELPRIPRSSSGINTPGQEWRKGGSSWAEGRRRLLDALLDLELWDEVLRLEESAWLESAGDSDEDLRVAHLTALAHFETGDQLGGLRKTVALFEQERALQKERDEAAKSAREKALAAKKNESDADKDADAARRPIERRIGRLRSRLGEVLFAQKLAAGEIESAKKQLGDLSDVSDVRLARYHAAVGNHDKAIELSKKASDAAANQVFPLAAHAAILAAAGKDAEAKAAFERLREVAGSADADLPVFRRVPLAQGDWRRPPAPAADVGERPALDHLGPAHWRPPVAPAWTAKFPDGRPIGSADLRGKPYVLMFYLGKGCAHCMEQLNAFVPKAADFETAGLKLFALSTDTPEGLASTVDQSGKPFPFPLASDQDLAAFKSFRAYDDFEARPLHSTVIVDGAGLIRWQHTSFNPFMKPEFVIEEARRLLKFPPPGPAVASQ